MPFKKLRRALKKEELEHSQPHNHRRVHLLPSTTTRGSHHRLTMVDFGLVFFPSSSSHEAMG